MNTQNRNERMTTNLIPVTGTGTILSQKGTPVDVMVVGMFYVEDRHFILHHDVDYPSYYMVTESSTGCAVTDYCYEDKDVTYKIARDILREKRPFLATSISNRLVQTRINLLKRNVGVQNLLLWMQ